MTPLPLPPHSKEKGFTPEDDQGEGMSEIPAFPCAQSPQTSRNQDGAPFQAGMTLRDYFAAHALAGEFAAQDEGTGIITDGTTDQWMLDRAKTFYRMADAMIKAREA